MALNRNVDGFSTVALSDPWSTFPRPDPTLYGTWFEDFLFYDKAQGNTAYTLTQTNGVDTIVGPTGVLLLTLGGADNDLAQLYLTDAAWQVTAGKKAFFEARVKVAKGSGGTIGQEEVVVGMTSVQTSTNFMNSGGTDRTFDSGIAFVSYDASTSWNCVQVVGDVVSVDAAASTYADDTWQRLTWYYDGSKTTFYVDDVQVAQLSGGEPTAVITPMLFVKAGGAHAKVLHVDYVMVAVER